MKNLLKLEYWRVGDLQKTRNHRRAESISPILHHSIILKTFKTQKVQLATTQFLFGG